MGLWKTENSTDLLNESEGRCQSELLIKKTKGDSNDDSKIKNKRIRKKDMHKWTSDNTYHKNSKIKFISFNENSKFEVLKISKHSNELSLIKSEELESLISENFEISNKEIILTENSFDQPIDEIWIQETKIINSKIKKRQRKLKSKLLSENKLNNFTTTLKAGKVWDKPKYKKRTKLLSSGESSSTEEIDLARRRDVVNKTILRILRRYLAQQFKLHVPQVNEEKVNKRQVFFKNIKEFAIKIFGESNPELNILHFYLASIIDPKFINESDIIESNANISDVKTFYDCLYKYSHTRLVNLFEVKPIGKNIWILLRAS